MIAYVRPNDEQLMFAARNGSSWDLELVCQGTGYYFDADLVVDSNGNPLIAYKLWTDTTSTGELCLATRTP